MEKNINNKDIWCIIIPDIKSKKIYRPKNIILYYLIFWKNKVIYNRCII